jgi:hypothetical protein
VSDPKLPASGESPSHQAVVAVEEHTLHSDIYDRLVSGPDDVPGMVAYGIYQIRKREWITFHKQRFDCWPTSEEVRKYSLSLRDNAVDALRQEAEADMYRFAEVIMHDRLREMARTAFNERTLRSLRD